ncbi:MAG: hypothetical protein KF773_22625 [Deltaproteobacteria bacterium]|nr:hypothetical protein [Deltaproteobacteria bacterium]MCW5808296.1 hypothetical protein [Deltaproteobacteria bacterium]
MIIIYGTRRGGKIDERDGQYALTRFAHVYYLPLFPVGSVWMTGSETGHQAKLSGRSVLAGYARTWGPLAGIGLLFAGATGIVAGVGLLALTAFTFTWHGLRTPSAKRRSDLNLLSFGTRCDPSMMPRELVDALRPEVEARWAELSGGATPSDVARFGTDDVARASAAYAVLRLTAIDLPRSQRAEAEADAARIVDNIRELGDGTGGPYRTAAHGDGAAHDEP